MFPSSCPACATSLGVQAGGGAREYLEWDHTGPWLMNDYRIPISRLNLIMVVALAAIVELGINTFYGRKAEAAGGAASDTNERIPTILSTTLP